MARKLLKIRFFFLFCQSFSIIFYRLLGKDQTQYGKILEAMLGFVDTVAWPRLRSLGECSIRF